MDAGLIIKVIVWTIVVGIVVYLLVKHREALRTFFDEVIIELKKSSWPTRHELRESTVVVSLAILALGICVSIYDFIFLRVIGFLINLG